MKICPRCNSVHEKPGVYCSRKCTNSRSFSDASRLQKSKSNIDFYNSLNEEEKLTIEKRLFDTRLNRQGVLACTLFDTEFENLSYQSKRKRVIIEQNFACVCCSLDSWLDMPITLELEHIDADRKIIPETT